MNREDLGNELERLHGSGFAWALGCCRRDREEAEDVLQETYLKILDGRARFAGGSSFKTFLFGVIRRTAAEHRRRTFLRRVRVAAFGRSGGGMSAPVPEPDGRLEGLRSAAAQLAPRQREVLELVFAHGMTLEEAARTLGIGLGSARTHYERAKKRLRQTLEGGRP
jgi:RNA polymerase sigma-70 factor (ECF subfamily)